MGGREDFKSIYSCLWFFSLLEQRRGAEGGKVTQTSFLAISLLENIDIVIKGQKEETPGSPLHQEGAKWMNIKSMHFRIGSQTPDLGLTKSKQLGKKASIETKL